jgi:hypothetical protein
LGQNVAVALAVVEVFGEEDVGTADSAAAGRQVGGAPEKVLE